MTEPKSMSQNGGPGEEAARYVNSALRDALPSWPQVTDFAEIGNGPTHVEFGFVVDGTNFVVRVEPA